MVLSIKVFENLTFFFLSFAIQQKSLKYCIYTKDFYLFFFLLSVRTYTGKAILLSTEYRMVCVCLSSRAVSFNVMYIK